MQLDQYELADLTGIDSEQWSEFLRDGKVQKYIERETELFKQAQMRKLIAKSTTNDKSVGTAQMLNAIGKTLEDDQRETNFFIYSHVPLTANECAAPMVMQDLTWAPPKDIEEDVQPEVPAEVKQQPAPQPVEEPEQEEKKDEPDEDWF